MRIVLGNDDQLQTAHKSSPMNRLEMVPLVERDDAAVIGIDFEIERSPAALVPRP